MTKPLTIAFIGRKQGTKHIKAPDFLGGWTLERPRKEEETGLSQSGLIKVDDVGSADLVYVRINPEQTNQRALKRVNTAIEKVPAGIPVLNSSKYFDRYADKAQCFRHWQEAALQCPEFQIWSPWLSRKRLVKTIMPLIRAYEGLYLRTNNEDSGKGIFFLSSETSEKDVLKTIHQVRWRCLINRVSHSKILAVEPIKIRDENGLNHVFRAHVVGESVLGGYALVGKGRIIHSRDQSLDDWDAFLQYNDQFQNIISQPAYKDQILRACHTLKVDIGAVEFFMTDSGLCFLEVNPMWGGHHRFGDEDFMKKLERNQDIAELANIKKWLNAGAYYQELYERLPSLMTNGH